MTNDLIFELGCEELPFASVGTLASNLTKEIALLLDKAQLSYNQIKPFATPRRLAVLISDLQSTQPSQSLVKRGPALSAAYDSEGNPTQALLGFAKSCNVETKALSRISTDKGEWIIFESQTPGVPTVQLIPELMQQALSALAIAKPMRWGRGEVEFARPIQWAVMLYGKEPIATNFFGIQSSNQSRGHRFHHPQPITIKDPQHYEAQLKDAFVVADFEVRKSEIKKQVEHLASTKQAVPILPEPLLDEITAIVEWPCALMGSFDKSFLEVPPEALIASMQLHQKCVALKDQAGNLLPFFITVANIASKNPQEVILGNEKVINARLSDAAFFFNQDKKTSLSHFIPATQQVIFQEKLGSLEDKSLRLKALMTYFSQALQLDEQQAQRAAILSKCDLMTGMVGEFPELQGLMGYYYALHDGEDKALACALKDHYLPRFAVDNLPDSNLSIALSLADRLDTLVGIFAIGQRPTGVKDPFKLRRHALAIARLLIASPTPLNVTTLIEVTLKQYAALFNYDEKLGCIDNSSITHSNPTSRGLSAGSSDVPGFLDPADKPRDIGVNLNCQQTLVIEIKEFILERLLAFYQNQNINSDLVLAARARQDEWLYDLDKRIQALKVFTTYPEASALAAACKRVGNLLNQAGIDTIGSDIDEALIVEPAEKMLYEQIKNVAEFIQPFYLSADYAPILKELARLKEPMDHFFDSLMVMVEEKQIKRNRLALMSKLQKVLQGVVDISKLQVS